jgi:hypothetical protein
MQVRGDRAARVRGVLRSLLVAGTSAAAALTAMALTPAASAGPPSATEGVTAAPVADREGHLRPVRQVGTRSSSGGARSGDFTGDGVGDILARDAGNGQLKVYPHSGTYQGTATFQSPVTINHGWGGFRWIGQGDITGDKLADVVYVDSGGVMRVAAHSGSFSGTGTLLAAQVIGTGWNINDLIFTYDYNADGFDDVFARRAGTGDTYIYFNNGGLSGTGTLQAAQLLLSGPAGADVDQSMGEFTGDGSPDMLLVQTDGVLGLFDFEASQTYTLGFGWEAINAITVTDVNRDGRPDVLGRRRSDGALLSYTHTGTWAPAADRTAYGTLRAPVRIGSGWQINNVIT